MIGLSKASEATLKIMGKIDHKQNHNIEKKPQQSMDCVHDSWELLGCTVYVRN